MRGACSSDRSALLPKPASLPSAWPSQGLLDRSAESLSGAVARSLSAQGEKVPGDLQTSLRKELGSSLKYDEAVDAQAQALHRDRERGRVEQLGASDARARANDLLQLSYRVARADFGLIFSIDGRGTVTRHFPDGDEAAQLEAGALIPLPRSYELDDAPRFERFFLVTGAKPFDSAAVVEAARSLAASGSAEQGALSLPAGLAQKALTLRKP